MDSNKCCLAQQICKLKKMHGDDIWEPMLRYASIYFFSFPWTAQCFKKKKIGHFHFHVMQVTWSRVSRGQWQISVTLLLYQQKCCSNTVIPKKTYCLCIVASWLPKPEEVETVVIHTCNVYRVRKQHVFLLSFGTGSWTYFFDFDDCHRFFLFVQIWMWHLFNQILQCNVFVGFFNGKQSLNGRKSMQMGFMFVHCSPALSRKCSAKRLKNNVKIKNGANTRLIQSI